MSKIIWKENDDGNLCPFVYYPDTGKLVESVWSPQDGSQRAFLTCPITEALYTSGRGTGKTDTLLMDFAKDVGLGHGREWRGVLFRRTFPELKDIINKSQKWFYSIWKEGKEVKYNASEHTWTWSTGESLLLRQFAKEEDYWKYHGSAFTWIAWEELTTWPDDSGYKKMFSLLRTSDKSVDQKKRVRATTNPSGCVPFGDVLTDQGWLPIQDVTTDNKVLSVTPEGETVLRDVTKVHEYDFDGGLKLRKGRGIHMEFTPEHRFPHLNTNRTAHTVKPFGELPGEAFIRSAGQPIKGRRPKSIMGFDPGDFMELLGWFISEGNVIRRKYEHNQFVINQVKTQHRTRIEELLTRMGLHYRKDNKSFTATHPKLAKLFHDQGYCRDKHIPDQFKDLDATLLSRLHESLMLGDGSASTYYTTSHQLANDFQDLCLKMGLRTHLSSRHRKNREGLSYSVNFQNGKCTRLTTGNHVYNVTTTQQEKNVEDKSFQGKVYCLSVDETETFYVRQNGSVWLSGNSGHGWVKDRFQLPVPHGKIIGDIVKTKGEPDRVAVHGHLQENRVLLHASPDYVDQLRASASSEYQLKAWLNGDWDIVAGGMFDDIWNPATHLINQFPTLAALDQGWRFDRSFDWGQTKPFSVGWWAESNGNPVYVDNGRPIGQVKGDLVRIDEWYGWNGKPNQGTNPRLLASQMAEEIRRREKAMGLWGHIKAGAADSSIFDPMEPGKTIAGSMKKFGVKWLPADKSKGSRTHGWMMIRERLEGAEYPSNGIREYPGLFVHSKCKQFIRTMPTLPRDEKNPDDVDTNSEDHIGDEVRYRVRAKYRSMGQSTF